MKVCLQTLGCVLMAFAVSGNVQGGLVGSMLSFDGVQDVVNDNSRALLIDNNGDDVLNAGDEIIGIMEFESIDGVDPGNFASGGIVLAIFSIRLSGAPIGLFGVQNHVAGGGGNAISSLLDASLHPGTYAIGANDFFAVVSTTTAANPFAANAEAVATSIANITAANGWMLDMIGGFDGVDDFFQTRATAGVGDIDAVVNGGNGNGIAEISEIIANDDGFGFAEERAVYTITYDSFGGVYAPVGQKDFFSVTHYGDIALTGGQVFSTAGGLDTGAHVTDDTNFTLNPIGAVPEPGSVVLLAIGLVGAAAGYRRRMVV